jgi:hypothetical protein
VKILLFILSAVVLLTLAILSGFLSKDDAKLLPSATESVPPENVQQTLPANGSVQDNRGTQDLYQVIQQQDAPVKLDDHGLLEIDAPKAASLTQSQWRMLEEKVKVTNQHIQNGIMKFDQDMNLLFDHRMD